MEKRKQWKRVICFVRGHDWDLAYHGPGGSGFVCMTCPAERHSGDKFTKEVPWASYLARRRFQKSIRNATPLKIIKIEDWKD